MSKSILDARSRDWCVTINVDSKTAGYNDPEQVKAAFESLQDKYEDFIGVYQIEEGQSGTDYIHIQGFLHFDNPHRGRAIQKVLTPTTKNAHIDVPKNRNAAANYARKEDTRVAGPYEFGSIDSLISGEYKQGKAKRTYYEAKALIWQGWRYYNFLMDDSWLEWALKHKQWIYDLRACYMEAKYSHLYRPVTCDYIFGPTGAGKSFSIFNLYKEADVFKVNLSSKNFPFDGYDGQPIIWIEEFRGQLPFNFLLQILEGYPMLVDIKGSHQWAAWEKVVISSSKPLNKLYFRSQEDESLDQAFRRFANGIVMNKTTWEQRLPYASVADAMIGKTTGYPNGAPLSWWEEQDTAFKWTKHIDIDLTELDLLDADMGDSSAIADPVDISTEEGANQEDSSSDVSDADKVTDADELDVSDNDIIQDCVDSQENSQQPPKPPVNYPPDDYYNPLDFMDAPDELDVSGIPTDDLGGGDSQ